MNLTARIRGEREDVVEQMKARGISARLVKGATIVEFPEERSKYKIPPELKDFELRINLSENGGGMTKTGLATVVCGLSGKPLHPYFIKKTGDLSNKEHAFFSIPGAVITVTASKNDEAVDIQEHRIKHDTDTTTAWIETKDIWIGGINSLPSLYERYWEAANAALDKACCYHCREPHYIAAETTTHFIREHHIDGLVAIAHPDNHFYNCSCGWRGDKLVYVDEEGRSSIIANHRRYQPNQGHCPKCGTPFTGCFK